MQWLFDHVVIVVRDLDQMIANYASAGFSVARGGRHADTSAENGLISLDGSSYIELFSFSEPEKAPRRHANWMPFEMGGGFGSFWFRTSTIEEDIGRMRLSGVPIEDSRVGTRMRPDGYEVRFRLAVPARHEHPFAPALIEDVTPLAERLPAAATHPNGVSQIYAVSCLVPDLHKAAVFYSSLIGAEAMEQAGGSTLTLRLGTTQLRLTEGAGAPGVQSIELLSKTGKRAVIATPMEAPIFA